MTLLFLFLSPPAKWHWRDVAMHAVHFWGQGSSYLSHQRLKMKGREKGKRASALGERSNTLHPLLVYEQNEQRLARPYFVQGQMLFFPSQFPSFTVTGRALSDETGSCSLVPKNKLHALWRHVGVILQGLSNKKAESYYWLDTGRERINVWSIFICLHLPSL